MGVARVITAESNGEAVGFRRTIPPPGSYVHPRAQIHRSVKLWPHVWIGEHVWIGARCEIGPGAVIGWDGFGYEWEGRWVRKPQTCGVTILADSHIGANVCIDRGSYRDTVIGRGCRIDNLVHVAHNVQMGRDCLVIAKAELSGSVVLGDRVWVGPSACVREHLTIGDDAQVGIGAVVVKDIPAGEVWCGNPARKLRDR